MFLGSRDRMKYLTMLANIRRLLQLWSTRLSYLEIIISQRNPKAQATPKIMTPIVLNTPSIVGSSLPPLILATCFLECLNNIILSQPTLNNNITSTVVGFDRKMTHPLTHSSTDESAASASHLCTLFRREYIKSCGEIE